MFRKVSGNMKIDNINAKASFKGLMIFGDEHGAVNTKYIRSIEPSSTFILDNKFKIKTDIGVKDVALPEGISMKNVYDAYAAAAKSNSSCVQVFDKDDKHNFRVTI